MEKKSSQHVLSYSSKKNGPLHMIKVALFMLRRHSTKKPNPVSVDVASKGRWKTLLGSMRPLHHHHLQHHQSPPPSITFEPTTTTQTVNDSFVDVLPPPMGLDLSPSSSSTYCSMSQYASAQNLQELDHVEGCGDGTDDDNGDKMIDTRADEFIAHFYEQMRLQRLESFNHYKEMVERGLH